MRLPTGTLRIAVDDADELDRLCAFAARRNPRRAFLVVSRVLGRHLPTRPSEARAAMAAMAAPLVEARLDGPVLVVGMAETATALGRGVHDAWRSGSGRIDSLYLQSSRQRVAGAELLTTFEEGHSHASTHLVQVGGGARERLDAARTLVLVDDESSTGNTFVQAATALVAALPGIERIRTSVLTDWSAGRYLPGLPRPAHAHALLSGALSFTPHAPPHAPPLAAGNGPVSGLAPSLTLAAASNAAGTAPAHGTPDRHGTARYPRPHRSRFDPAGAARTVVLGDGEFSWEALLLAEEIESAGGAAWVQCITRSPALPGQAMTSVTPLSDSYGSGAPCFVYNLLACRPDRIVVVSENDGAQARELRAWLEAHGDDVPVCLVTCRFDPDDPTAPGVPDAREARHAP